MKTTKRSPQKKSLEYGIQESSLMKLLEYELKDMYWAEKALVKSLPKLIKSATAQELKDALQMHLDETERQVEKVEKVFEALGKKASSTKCEAMDGLIKEAEEIMKNSEVGAMRDAGIISAAQKIEHYEIASYGTLRAFAKILDQGSVADLLEEILEEEKDADLKLTEVTGSIIRIEQEMEMEPM